MDFKYEDLLKTKIGKNLFMQDSDEEEDDKDDGNEAAPTKNIFTKRQLQTLKHMPVDKSDDSTFVLNCVEYAYKDNIRVLGKKSVFGKAETVLVSENGDADKVIPGKDPMTPVKVEAIKALFIERISKCRLGSVAQAERINDAYVNRLILTSVRNIAKRKENQQ